MKRKVDLSEVIYPMKLLITEGLVNIIRKLGKSIEQIIKFYANVVPYSDTSIEEIVILIDGQVEILVRESFNKGILEFIQHISQTEVVEVGFVEKAKLVQNCIYLETCLPSLIKSMISEHLPENLQESLNKF